MSKAKDHSLTPTEPEIMNVLWETGPANVQTIQQRLPRELAYTTAQTMLNILHRKGKAPRSLKRRAYFYKDVVSRQQVASHAISGLVDRPVDGAAENLVMSLPETKHLPPQKLAKLNEVIKAPSQ